MPGTKDQFLTYTSMMRVTSTGRPFAKDLYDMFAAVLLQIKLTDHRVLFRQYPYTFTTDEAIKVMSELVFIHIHRSPDSLNPTRQVATRTTTTFSMDSSAAKNMIQHFLSARLICSATDPVNFIVKDRGLWWPTLKGKYVLEEFIDYTQVEITESLTAALSTPNVLNNPGSNNYSNSGNSTGPRTIMLDRLTADDQITFSRPNMTIAFKAMMNSLSHTELLIDDIGGIEKKNLAIFKYTFMGIHCVEWLTERLTVTSKEEAEQVAAEFVLFGWVAQVIDKSDKSLSVKDDTMSFKTSRNMIYYVTERGCMIVGWTTAPSDETVTAKAAPSIISHSSATSSDVSLGSSDASNASISAAALIKANKRSIISEKPVTPAAALLAPAKPKYETSSEMTRVDSATALVEQITLSPQFDTIQSITLEQQRSQDVIGMIRPLSMSLTESSMSYTSSASDIASITTPPTCQPRDLSQWTRLHQILATPLLRMYFRDFLRQNYCVENINFWVDHNALLKNLQSGSKTVLEQLAECYTIYETYLGVNATADVNIDHVLHQETIEYVSASFYVMSQAPTATQTNSGILPYFICPVISETVQPNASNTAARSVGTKSGSSGSGGVNRLLLLPPQVNVKQNIVVVRGGQTPDRCLLKLLGIFGKVNDHVCRIMAEDSVPKFIKTSKYIDLIKKQQRKQEEGLEDDDAISDDDSDTDGGKDLIHLRTALSEQRTTLMDRHKRAE